MVDLPIINHKLIIDQDNEKRNEQKGISSGIRGIKNVFGRSNGPGNTVDSITE